MTDATRSSLAGRSGRQWMVRGALAILAAIAAWFSVSDTLANAVVKIDPERAHVLAPWDGTITAELAEQRMVMAPASDSNSQPARLARRALRQDATAVEALTVLGLQAQLRGETEEARQLFSHSLSLSRRELRPRLWAIEEAVSRGDIDGALQHYDIALRTSRQASDILLPVLASAISEPRVRSRLIAVTKTDPAWEEYFVNYVALGRIDPEAAVLFFEEGRSAGLPVDDADRTSIVNALVGRGLVEAAWDYYASFRGAASAISRDADFSALIESPAVFDWTPRSAQGMSASIQRSSEGGVVDFSAAPSTGGVVLEQHQVLPPGTYRLESVITDLQQPERSRPYWVLTCIGGAELGRIEVPNSEPNDGRVTGRFTVPSNCPAQILALTVRPSDEISGVYGRVRYAELRPAGGRD